MGEEMKVAICLYDINDLGGIINHTEWLAQGLKELGARVDLLQLGAPLQRHSAPRAPLTTTWVT